MTHPNTEELKNIALLKSMNVEMLNDTVYLSIIGAATIQVQTVEYNMLGLIIHLNENLLSNSEHFGKLTAEIFFSNDKKDRKLRRQTLGQIIGFLKEDVKIFDNEELDRLLDLRNEFTHNLFRKYLSHGRDKNPDLKYMVFQLSLELYELSLKWTSIFKGFLYELILDMKNKGSLGDDFLRDHEHLKLHHESFLNSLKSKNINNTSK